MYAYFMPIGGAWVSQRRGGFGVRKICSFLQQRVFGCEQDMGANKDEMVAIF